MATSFSEPKLKAFPDPAALASARRPDAELPVHPGGELVPAGDARHGPQGAVLPHRPRAAAGRGRGWPPRRTLPPQLALAHGLLAAHSASFTLNGQVWVCARYCRWYRRDPAALDRFLHAAAAELRGLPWLREAVCIGSLGRAGWPAATGPISTCASCFRRGRSLAAGQSAAAASARTRAFVGRIPLDLYAYERPERLRRFDQRERLLVLLDRDGRLRRALSTSRHCLAVTLGLDREPAHLLGLLAGRASGRARARDRRHQLHRPLRRDLRRRPPAQRCQPSAPISSATRAARSGAPCATSPSRWS